jgi:hypothetical protein
MDVALISDPGPEPERSAVGMAVGWSPIATLPVDPQADDTTATTMASTTNGTSTHLDVERPPASAIQIVGHRDRPAP